MKRVNIISTQSKNMNSLKSMYTTILMSFFMATFLMGTHVADQIPSEYTLLVKYAKVLDDGTWRAALEIGLESLYDEKGHLYTVNQLVDVLHNARPNMVFAHSEPHVASEKKVYKNPDVVRLFIDTGERIRLKPKGNGGTTHNGPLAIAHLELLSQAVEQCHFISELNFQGFHFDDHMLRHLALLKKHLEHRNLDIFLGHGKFNVYNKQLRTIETQSLPQKQPSAIATRLASHMVNQITPIAPSSSSSSLKSSTINNVDVITEPPLPSFEISLNVIEDYKIPHRFPKAALVAASSLQLPKSFGNRVDVRTIPLVTIDDHDAQDHDDAVWAEKTTQGWRIIVAIADVSYFVKPADVLDKEAMLRGNSVYLPGVVVPMFPTQLSNNLGSLKPHVDRPCLAVELHINHQAILTHFRFFRAIMKSHARLSYQDVEMAYKKRPSSVPVSIQEHVIPALYGAYAALKKARHVRGTLELNRQEKKIIFSEDRSVQRIIVRPRYDSHRMIEELMVLANVAAALFLENHQMPTLYRVHELPKEEQITELENWLKDKYLAGKKFSQMDQRSLSELLEIVFDGKYESEVGELVIKTLTQASYTPSNKGHWGLNLEKYVHFTSPIRRYADLIVHRGIISILENDPFAYYYSSHYLSQLGQAISFTDQRAGRAEREAIKRYTNTVKQSN